MTSGGVWVQAVAGGLQLQGETGESSPALDSVQARTPGFCAVLRVMPQPWGVGGTGGWGDDISVGIWKQNECWRAWLRADPVLRCGRSTLLRQELGASRRSGEPAALFGGRKGETALAETVLPGQSVQTVGGGLMGGKQGGKRSQTGARERRRAVQSWERVRRQR